MLWTLTVLKRCSTSSSFYAKEGNMESSTCCYKSLSLFSLHNTCYLIQAGSLVSFSSHCISLAHFPDSLFLIFACLQAIAGLTIELRLQNSHQKPPQPESTLSTHNSKHVASSLLDPLTVAWKTCEYIMGATTRGCRQEHVVPACGLALTIPWPHETSH